MIAFLVNTRITDGAICQVDLCRRISQSGVESKLFGREFADAIPPELAERFELSTLRDPAWWRKRGITVASFYAMNTFPKEVLEAARMAGAIIVLEADTSGFISFRDHPWQRFLESWDDRCTTWQKLQRIKAWAYVVRKTPQIMDAVMIANAEEAHYIKVESRMPAVLTRRYFRRRGRADLATKVIVRSFAVRDSFLGLIPSEKERLLIVAGRMAAPQKNPTFVAALLDSFSRENPDWRVEIHSRGSCEILERLAGRRKNVTYSEETTRDAMAERLCRARILLSGSRFESTPIVGLEAFCTGATAVAPALPGWRSLIRGSAFGRTFPPGDSKAAESQLRREVETWEAGGRDPSHIAARWRNECSLEHVAETYLDFAKTHQSLQVGSAVSGLQ